MIPGELRERDDTLLVARESARMVKREKKSETAATGKPKPARGAKSGKGVGRAQVVKNMLTQMEKKIGSDQMKATMGDYIRLVQLHKELDDEAPREIKVTWVEPVETGSGSGE
jgi:hypothetical protein